MENTELAKRMYLCAIDYKRSARRLSEVTDHGHGHSASFLSVLALEVLLKCVHFLDRDEPAKSHDYSKIWSKISEKSRQEILAKAAFCNPGHADMRKLETALVSWQRVFSTGRYHYEINADLAVEEIEKAGKDWLEQGGDPEKADLAYYPMELRSLFFGQRKWIEVKLNIHSDLPE